MSLNNFEDDEPQSPLLDLVVGSEAEPDTLGREAALAAPGFQRAARRVLTEIMGPEGSAAVFKLDDSSLEQEIYNSTTEYISQLADRPAQQRRAEFEQRRLYGRLAGKTDADLVEEATATATAKPPTQAAIIYGRKLLIAETHDFLQARFTEAGGQVIDFAIASEQLSQETVAEPRQLEQEVSQFCENRNLGKGAVKALLGRLDVNRSVPIPLTDEAVKALTALGDVYRGAVGENPRLLTDLESQIIEMITGTTPAADQESKSGLRYPLWMTEQELAEQLNAKQQTATQTLADAIGKLNQLHTD